MENSEDLQSALAEVRVAIDAAHSRDDTESAETGLIIAALNSRMWGIRRRIAEVAGDTRGEAAADKMQREWEAQRARMHAQRKVDLLPKVMRALESQQELADELSSLE